MEQKKRGRERESSKTSKTKVNHELKLKLSASAYSKFFTKMSFNCWLWSFYTPISLYILWSLSNKILMFLGSKRFLDRSNGRGKELKSMATGHYVNEQADAKHIMHIQIGREGESGKTNQRNHQMMGYAVVFPFYSARTHTEQRTNSTSGNGISKSSSCSTTTTTTMTSSSTSSNGSEREGEKA